MLSTAKVTVDRTSEEQHAIVKGAIAQGVMRLTRLTRQITTYRVKTADPGEHHLLIEHPRVVGWSLTAPDPTHVELSANAYRIPVALPGDTQGTLAVTMGTAGGNDPASRPHRRSARRARGVKRNRTFGQECARRARFAAASAWTPERRAREAEGATSPAVEDEQRLRDNLAAVGRDTALYKQTLDKLGEPKPRSPPCPPTSAQLPPRLRRPRNSCNISSLPSPFEREGPERQCTPDDAA